jgi:hypothetical protein
MLRAMALRGGSRIRFVSLSLSLLPLSLSLYAAPLAAQTLPPPQQRYIVTGCVSRAGNAFVITDPRGDAPTVYRIEGDRAKLELHVGQTLQITGPLERIPEASGAKAPNAPTYTIKVEKITYVSKTCAEPRRP